MVNDTSSLDNNFIVLVVYLVLRLKIPRMPCLSTPFFDIELIGLEVSDLVQMIIGNGSQPYEGNYV